MAEEKTTYTAEEVEEIKAQLEAKHNSEMASQRKKFDADLQKQKLSAEEQAKLEREEADKEKDEELNSLRAYKKDAELKARLEKENLPVFFKNDNRLLNAKDDKELDSVIKTIKQEFSSLSQKGASHSTIITTTDNNGSSGKLDGKGMDDIIRNKAGR